MNTTGIISSRSSAQPTINKERNKKEWKKKSIFRNVYFGAGLARFKNSNRRVNRRRSNRFSAMYTYTPCTSCDVLTVVVGLGLGLVLRRVVSESQEANRIQALERKMQTDYVRRFVLSRVYFRHVSFERFLWNILLSFRARFNCRLRSLSEWRDMKLYSTQKLARFIRREPNWEAEMDARAAERNNEAHI